MVRVFCCSIDHLKFLLLLTDFKSHC